MKYYLEIIQPIIERSLDRLGILYDDLKFEIPSNPDFGDISTNIAFKLSKKLKNPPKLIAEKIVDNLEFDLGLIEKAKIEGAGFINFYLSTEFYIQALKKLLSKGTNIGRFDLGYGKRVNVEYVSVNPTGLLHLGHGRNACIGDTISNLYEWLGYDVTREYYFNNAGNQMTMLANSIYARYMQLYFEKDYPFPEDGYHGEYIIEIAKDLYDHYADKLKDNNDNNLNLIKKFGENWCFNKIKKTLERLRIRQDIYFNEDSLYTDGKIDALLNEFKSRQLSYEKDGAIWLALSQLGLENDRVIVKSSGEPTYRLPDIAYHKDKFERGYDLIIDIFGADHIATIPDVLAAVSALGYDISKVKVLIHQFVTLFEDGQQVKMSKRTGKSYTLDDLLDEVGPDVVRFFLIMRSISTHLEFDLNLAREQSEKNPIYYLQYAHARICSIFENAKSFGIILDDDYDLNLIGTKYEINLIKSLLGFEDAILSATDKSEPHILCDYLKTIAQAFHIFYHNDRIISQNLELAKARLKLIEMTKYILKNGLSILGVSAPEKM